VIKSRVASLRSLQAEQLLWAIKQFSMKSFSKSPGNEPSSRQVVEISRRPKVKPAGKRPRIAQSTLNHKRKSKSQGAAAAREGLSSSTPPQPNPQLIMLCASESLLLGLGILGLSRIRLLIFIRPQSPERHLKCLSSLPRAVCLESPCCALGIRLTSL